MEHLHCQYSPRFDLPIPIHLFATILDSSMSLDSISANRRPDLGPARPVDSSKEQNSNPDDGEHEIRISLAIPIAIRRDKRDDGEEHVGQQVQYTDRQVCKPRRCPVLGFSVMEINETSGNESIYPSTGVGTAIA